MSSPEVKQTHFDSIVVGAGMAGLAAARSLGEQGQSVALVEKRGEGNNTPKSLFVNGDSHLPPDFMDALEARGGVFPCPSFLLINVDRPKRGVRVPNAANTHALSHDVVIDYGRERLGPNVTQIYDRVSGGVEHPDGVEIQLGSKTLTADTVVDASGSYSPLSRNYTAPDGKPLLNDDPYVLWVRGVHGQGEFQPGVMINPIGRDLGISWTMAYSEGEGDVVACDNSRMFPNARRNPLDPRRQQKILDNLLEYCAANDLARVDEVDYRFSSVIRAEPIPRSAARRTQRLYAVGEAGGMGEPHMNEVIPVALHWGDKVGEFIAEGRSPLDFYTQWRHTDQIFPYDKSLAMLHRRVRKESRGEYGSGALFYQALAEVFPVDAQQEIFKTRRLEKHHAPYIARAVMRKPSILGAMAEVGVRYAAVKAQNLLYR